MLVRQEGRPPVETPLNLVKRVTLLTKAASISADLLATAAARGLEILVLDDHGRVAARAAAAQAPQHGLTVAQAGLAAGPAGLDLARLFVLGKVVNQARLLRYLSKYRARQGCDAGELTRAAEEMEGSLGAIEALVWDVKDLDLGRNRLFAAEGRAAERYWRALAPLIPASAGFPGRVRQGAADLTNSPQLWLRHPLRTPGRVAGARRSQSGDRFLHKPRDGREALLYDFIEEFRAAAVDRVVLRQLGLRKPYAVESDGLALETRRDLARAVGARLRAPTAYRGETVPLQEVMNEQARRLARHVLGREPYRPWRMPW